MQLIRRICLAGLLLPVVAQAQVQNGDFEAGPAGWVWVNGNSRSPFECPLDVPGEFLIEEVNHGQVAWFWAGDSYEPGTTYFCRQIHQNLTVPQGSRLIFDAKLGERIYESPNVSYNWNNVGLSIYLDVGGSRVTSKSVSGSSKDQSCDSFNSCPRYVEYEIDVSKAWGQTARLTFHTKSSHEHGAIGGVIAYASPAFVDNVRFEPAPLPSIPGLASPGVNGNDHSISWSARAYTSHYVLQQKIDNGSWTQVYSGPDLGWTMRSAPAADYRYRVQACGNGCSAFSGEVVVNVPQATPGTPTANIVGRSFQLSWGASDGAVSYVLEQKGENGLWTTAYDGPATQSTLYNIPPGIYGYRVKACGSVVCSTYSDEQYFTAVDVTPVIVDYLL